MTTPLIEEWKYVNIEEYTRYKVSNLGRVKSIRGFIRKLTKTNQGYLSCSLYNRNTKKNKMSSVHRLVALSFIPNPDNLPIVNHKDGNKENNTVNNLEWFSYSQNVIHSYTVLNKKPKGISVNHYNKENNLIKTYDSLDSALRETHTSIKTIVSSCKTHEKTGELTTWRYCEYKKTKEENLILEDGEDSKIINGYENYIITSYGKVYSKNTKRFLAQTISNGYYSVSLWKNNKDKHCRVNILVAQMFIPNNNAENIIVNHKDGNKLNNNIDNLEWSTFSKNTIHAVQTGLMSTKKIATLNNSNEIVAVFWNLKRLNTLLDNCIDTHIIAVCRGKRKTSLGYKWKYISEDTYQEYKDKVQDLKIQCNANGRKNIEKYDIKTGILIETFSSATDALKSIGVESRGQLKQAVLKNNGIYKGFRWVYGEPMYIKILTKQQIDKINNEYSGLTWKGNIQDLLLPIE